MKKIFMLFSVFLVVSACTKYSVNKDKLEGKWQLTAMYVQTNGPGAWHTMNTTAPDFIQFNSDGSLSMTAYVSTLYNDPTVYTVTSDTTMTIHCPYLQGNVIHDYLLYYKLTDSVLTITPPSMEFVQEKYIRVSAQP